MRVAPAGTFAGAATASSWVPPTHAARAEAENHPSAEVTAAGAACAKAAAEARLDPLPRDGLLEASCAAAAEAGDGTRCPGV